VLASRAEAEAEAEEWRDSVRLAQLQKERMSPYGHETYGPSYGPSYAEIAARFGYAEVAARFGEIEDIEDIGPAPDDEGSEESDNDEESDYDEESEESDSAPNVARHLVLAAGAKAKETAEERSERVWVACQKEAHEEAIRMGMEYDPGTRDYFWPRAYSCQGVVGRKRPAAGEN
jgi:hypothetical protein